MILGSILWGREWYWRQRELSTGQLLATVNVLTLVAASSAIGHGVNAAKKKSCVGDGDVWVDCKT